MGGATRCSVWGRSSRPGISIHAPRGGSDQLRRVLVPGHKGFQSTLPVGGATQGQSGPMPNAPISIHAPRGGSDGVLRAALQSFRYFNPRSPWGERLTIFSSRPVESVFQSTLPVGGATVQSYLCAALEEISIHAPRGGSDTLSTFVIHRHFDFNPRSPWGERLLTGYAPVFSS